MWLVGGLTCFGVLGLVATASASSDTSNPLVAYGLLGIILTAFVSLVLTGKLVSGKTYDRELQRSERLQARNEQLEQSIRDDILPTMTRFLDLQADLTLRRRQGD